MNKKSIFYITVLLVCVFASLGFSKKNSIVYKDDNIKKYLNEQKPEMSTMMEDMKNIKHTGDPAIDFLYGMIPHHKAAIEMSESLLKYGGENTEIKKIAENIITNQSKEIEEMKDMIKRMELNPKIDEKKEQDYFKEYNNLLNKHKNNDMSNVNSVDKAFAMEMIKHHEIAVSMSEIVLKYTDNKDVVDLAQNIIESQKAEIKQMREIINSMEK
ncbi:DUF305 domain-containing protein [Paraclostridium bifermentans]|uniref:DUF305 domain-containing protein n=1 Tax=Paraclostridium bifermentans TaxID=1490 RepID=UPI0006B3468C|nr:DUF305 domain-containing protein [Paraclostridium bifermentans]